MKPKVYKQRVSFTQYSLRTNNPHDFFRRKFERDASQKMDVIDDLYWVPVLSEDGTEMVSIEFVAEGYNEKV